MPRQKNLPRRRRSSRGSRERDGCQELVRGGAGAGGMGDVGFAQLGMGPRWRPVSAEAMSWEVGLVERWGCAAVRGGKMGTGRPRGDGGVGVRCRQEREALWATRKGQRMR